MECVESPDSWLCQWRPWNPLPLLLFLLHITICRNNMGSDIWGEIHNLSYLEGLLAYFTDFQFRQYEEALNHKVSYICRNVIGLCFSQQYIYKCWPLVLLWLRFPVNVESNDTLFSLFRTFCFYGFQKSQPMLVWMWTVCMNMDCLCVSVNRWSLLASCLLPYVSPCPVTTVGDSHKQ